MLSGLGRIVRWTRESLDSPDRRGPRSGHRAHRRHRQQCRSTPWSGIVTDVSHNPDPVMRPARTGDLARTNGKCRRRQTLFSDRANSESSDGEPPTRRPPQNTVSIRYQRAKHRLSAARWWSDMRTQRCRSPFGGCDTAGRDTDSYRRHRPANPSRAAATPMRAPGSGGRPEGPRRPSLNGTVLPTSGRRSGPRRVRRVKFGH